MAFDDEGNEVEDAAGLRKQLAKLGGELKSANEKIATFESQSLVVSKKFTLVEASELASIPADEREKKAEELQNQRLGLQKTLLRSALASEFEDEDALEARVAELLGETPAEEASAHEERVGVARELSNITSPPGPVVDPRQLHGEQAIAASFSKKK